MTKTFRCLATAALGTVLLAQPGSGFADTQPVLGPGASTCGKWTEERKHEKYPHQLGWVLGFISSYNHFSDTNVFGDSDADAIAAWMDNYCAANPLDTIYHASIDLIDELRRRRSRR